MTVQGKKQCALRPTAARADCRERKAETECEKARQTTLIALSLRRSSLALAWAYDAKSLIVRKPVTVHG
jgi:hypothetical protein